MQNLTPGFNGLPHDGHTADDSTGLICAAGAETGVPHPMQNLAPGFNGLPHDGHTADDTADFT